MKYRNEDGAVVVTRTDERPGPMWRSGAWPAHMDMTQDPVLHETANSPTKARAKLDNVLRARGFSPVRRGRSTQGEVAS